jgi:tRNA nucleotidyltransferase/poly(A) polymerase
MRTPVPALVTFRFDPLRVLRAFRFACAFGFRIHADSLEAARHHDIHAALCSATSISRERVAKEARRILNSRRLLLGLDLLDSTHLVPALVCIPSQGGAPLHEEDARRCTNAVRLVHTHTLDADLSPLHRELLLWAALLLPVRHRSVETVKARRVPLAEHILVTQLRGSFLARESRQVALLHELVEPVAALVARDLLSVSRAELGLLVRKAGELWRALLRLSVCVLLLPLVDEPDATHVVQQTIAAHRTLEQAVFERGLDTAYLLSPIYRVGCCCVYVRVCVCVCLDVLKTMSLCSLSCG